MAVTVKNEIQKLRPMDGGPMRVVLSAWGADDMGVEMQHSFDMVELADARYNHWKKYIFDRITDGVSEECFFEHGFVPA